MKTIAFYSYKGGVGRSLALANIASRLSEFGRQVCLLDFDLEAPGLHYKFSSNLNNRGIEIKKGIVDYIYQFTSTGNVPPTLSEFSYAFLSSPRAITTLIPAGNINSPEYWKKLASVNWYDLLYEDPIGISFLLDLKEKIKKEFAPDFLLIDSRTGISEMSGIPLALLADEVVIVAANNRENLEGAKKIIKSVTDSQNSITGTIPKVTFVLSRIPFTDRPDDKAKEQALVEKIKREFGQLIEDINIIHSDRDLEENEQLKIGYEKDESTAQISRDYLKLFEALTINDLKPEEINDFKNIKDSEKCYQKAISEPVLTKRLEYISKAIELNNSNIEFLIFRALTYGLLADEKKVIEDCEAAIYLDTSNLFAYEIKGNAQLRLKEYENAKSTFERVLDFNPDRFRAKLGLARIATVQEEYDKALSYYDEIIEKDQQNHVAYNERANIKRLKGLHVSALEDVYKSLELNVDFAAAFITLAKINGQLQNKNEFYLNLEKGLKLDSKIAETIILNDQISFSLFLKEQRFINLLDRYNIHLDNGNTINTK